MVVEKFEIDEVQQERLVEEGVAPVVNADVTDRGVIVSMEQALMDSRYIYLLLKIEAPEDITLSENILFENFTLTLDGGKPDFSYTAKIVDEDTTDNISYWEVWINNTMFRNELHDKTLGIHLENLRDNVVKANEGDELINGRWNLEWQMVYEDSETVFEVNRQIPGRDATVKSITLSPLSIEVLYDWELKKVVVDAVDKNGEHFKAHDYEAPPEVVAFRMEDGSRQTIDISGPGSTGFAGEDCSEYSWSYGMEKVVTVDEVEAAIFFDPLSGTETEIQLR